MVFGQRDAKLSRSRLLGSLTLTIAVIPPERRATQKLGLEGPNNSKLDGHPPTTTQRTENICLWATHSARSP